MKSNLTLFRNPKATLTGEALYKAMVEYSAKCCELARALILDDLHRTAKGDAACLNVHDSLPILVKAFEHEFEMLRQHGPFYLKHGAPAVEATAGPPKADIK